MNDQVRRKELGNFLRTRRARLTPSEIGVIPVPRRRVSGLTRGEVAKLADVSWYTSLEQARNIRVSSRVLENLASGLRLNAIERALLFELAGQPRTSGRPYRGRRVSPFIQRTLDNMDTTPALVLGPRWDVLAWNRAARATITDYEALPPRERNALWLLFTDQVAPNSLLDWETHAHSRLARFRLDYDRHAGEPDFVQLVDRLKRVSPQFALWWAQHDLEPQSSVRLNVNHPVLGRLVWEHTTLAFRDDPELKLDLFTPTADYNSIAKVRRAIKLFDPEKPGYAGKPRVDFHHAKAND